MAYKVNNMDNTYEIQVLSNNYITKCKCSTSALRKWVYSEVKKAVYVARLYCSGTGYKKNISSLKYITYIQNRTRHIVLFI